MVALQTTKVVQVSTCMYQLNSPLSEHLNGLFLNVEWPLIRVTMAVLISLGHQKYRNLYKLYVDSK